MYFCPYCGTKVHEDEHYCMKCGKAIPDIESRLVDKKFNRWWILPIISTIVVSISIAIFTYVLDYKNTKALELYVQAEKRLLNEEYDEATDLLEASIQHKKDFTYAQVALDYSKAAIQIEEQLKKAGDLSKREDYKAAIDLLRDAEENLNMYQGPLVSSLVEKIDTLHADVQLEQLRAIIAEGPSIDVIRLLIWEAEEINHPDAKEVAEQLRNQLVEYTFSKASEALNENQFNDAILITEDGLKYAPESEKLQSLLTNINKEKLSFESALQDRMEQAMDTAYADYRKNANDAIELVSVEMENNDEGQLAIKGEVKSIATVPINSILVEYTLARDDVEFVTNEIYVFPSTLYPGEIGKFGFTHFDLKDDSDDMTVNIKKITWYTD